MRKQEGAIFIHLHSLLHTSAAGRQGRRQSPRQRGWRGDTDLPGTRQPGQDYPQVLLPSPSQRTHTHTSLSLFQHLILSATKQDPKTSGKKKKKEKAGWGHSRVSPGPAEHSRGSAVAEEALREVELEGLQAHGAPARGEKGEVGSPTSASRQVWGKCKLRDLLHVPGVGDNNASRARGPHLTRRRHIFSWGNSLGPSTLVSWGSVSR